MSSGVPYAVLYPEVNTAISDAAVQTREEVSSRTAPTGKKKGYTQSLFHDLRAQESMAMVSSPSSAIPS